MLLHCRSNIHNYFYLFYNLVINFYKCRFITLFVQSTVNQAINNVMNSAPYADFMVS